MSTAEITSRHVDVNGLRMHVTEVGTGPLVVLLHGFPDFSYSWRHQMRALADAGYRAVAPDLRGFNTTERPPGVDSYRLDHVTRDVTGLIRALGEDAAAAVVGHDWGGAVAWYLAARYPEATERVVVLNCPHLTRMGEGLRSPRQILRSWYMLFFQLPVLPERFLAAGDYGPLRAALRAGVVRDDAFTDEDLQRHVAAAKASGGLGGGINYYRSMGRAKIRNRWRMPSDTRGSVDVPTLVIWGEQDFVLGPELADPPAALVPDARVVRVEDAGHWVHLDAAELVNAELLAFLGTDPEYAPK
jgi:epoxide hydrolase 4